MTYIATVKGWIFIIVTASLLYSLISRAFITLLHNQQELQQAHQSLKSANSLYESVLRAAHTYAIIATDQYGLIQVFNEGAERLLGYTAAEMVNKKTVLLLHDPAEIAERSAELGIPPSFDVFVIAALQNRIEKRRWTYIHKNGCQIPVHLSVSAQRDDSGNLLGFLGIANDISDRLQAEAALQEERKFTDAVMHSVPGLLYLCDTDSHLTRWNRQCEEVTGYSNNELSLMKLQDWYPNTDSSIHNMESVIQRCLRDGFADIETELHTKDNRWIPFYLTFVRLEIDKKTYFTGIGIDITARKKAETALLQINNELEQRVEYRTHELTAANEELTSLNEELLHANIELSKLNEALQQTQESLIRSEKIAILARLVAGMAHEINTPIGLCITLSSHLNVTNRQFITQYHNHSITRNELDSYLEDVRETGEMIQTNIERAAKLVKNFKQVSADQAAETHRNFNIGEYIDDILLSMTTTLENSGHRISISIPHDLTIDGYPGAFAQIITNLLINSLTHAYDPGQKGTLRITGRYEGNFITLQYSDDGKGIHPHETDHIYEPFFTTRRTQGATGLGLTIVYNLVTQLYGGSIYCQSAPGEGTTFTINLPITQDTFITPS